MGRDVPPVHRQRGVQLEVAANVVKTDVVLLHPGGPRSADPPGPFCLDCREDEVVDELPPAGLHRDLHCLGLHRARSSVPTRVSCLDLPREKKNVDFSIKCSVIAHTGSRSSHNSREYRLTLHVGRLSSLKR